MKENNNISNLLVHGFDISIPEEYVDCFSSKLNSKNVSKKIKINELGPGWRMVCNNHCETFEENPIKLIEFIHKYRESLLESDIGLDPIPQTYLRKILPFFPDPILSNKSSLNLKNNEYCIILEDENDKIELTGNFSPSNIFSKLEELIRKRNLATQKFITQIEIGIEYNSKEIWYLNFYDSNI